MNVHTLFRSLVVVWIGVVMWMGTVSPALAEAPAHDDFDSASVIPALPFSDQLYTGEATSASDDPVDCTNNGSVWYTFTPDVDMQLRANTFGSDYDTVLSVYTGLRGDLALVPSLCNDDFDGTHSQVSFAATGGTTYYFLIGFCCGSGNAGGGNLVFSVETVAPPPNDHFVNATVASVLPFADTVEITAATLEAAEPAPSCYSPSDLSRSVWYAFTPTTDGLAWVRAFGDFETYLTIYTGTSLDDLTEVLCGGYGSGGQMTMALAAGTPYYFQIGSLYQQNGTLQFAIENAPQPEVSFSYSPWDPSRYDTIQFFDFAYDPAGLGIASYAWDFGDGATETGCCRTHQYGEDGEYVVTLTVTTPDGRQATATQTIQVVTHDVVITKFETPKSGRMDQTRTIVVGLNNRIRPETVTIELFSSQPDGYRLVGTLTQYVPQHNNQRTTDFSFSYTFTPQDAAVGRVTFRAVATINIGRDALPFDNEAISFPTNVTGARAAAAESAEATETQEGFVLRSQMDEYPEMRDLFLLPTRWLYLPLVDGIDD